MADLIRDEIDGIIALGTIGDNPSLSPEEKRGFIKHIVKNIRIPRLLLIGEQRVEAKQVVAQVLETRINLDKYNIG